MPVIAGGCCLSPVPSVEARGFSTKVVLLADASSQSPHTRCLTHITLDSKASNEMNLQALLTAPWESMGIPRISRGSKKSLGTSRGAKGVLVALGNFSGT